MNTKTTIITTATFAFLILFFLSNLSFAQGLTTPCNGGDPDVDCPIDSGIVVLFIAAAVYTFIKIYKNKPINEIK